MRIIKKNSNRKHTRWYLLFLYKKYVRTSSVLCFWSNQLTNKTMKLTLIMIAQQPISTTIKYTNNKHFIADL